MVIMWKKRTSRTSCKTSWCDGRRSKHHSVSRRVRERESTWSSHWIVQRVKNKLDEEEEDAWLLSARIIGIRQAKHFAIPRCGRQRRSVTRGFVLVREPVSSVSTVSPWQYERGAQGRCVRPRRRWTSSRQTRRQPSSKAEELYPGQHWGASKTLLRAEGGYCKAKKARTMTRVLIHTTLLCLRWLTSEHLVFCWSTTRTEPSGGLRSIVLGDSFPRLIARTITQKVRTAVEEATAPFQHVLSTSSGGECVGWSYTCPSFPWDPIGSRIGASGCPVGLGVEKVLLQVAFVWR